MLTKTSPALLAEPAVATLDAQYFEYTSSANPIRLRSSSRACLSASFPPSLYAEGAT